MDLEIDSKSNYNEMARLRMSQDENHQSENLWSQRLAERQEELDKLNQNNSYFGDQLSMKD